MVFGEVAELYDRARAGYSDAVIDRILSFARPESPLLSALEVGAGTGKATVPIAARGLEVLALEPSAAMAAVAARNCESFPSVRIEVTSFEDWPLEPNRFDLLFSAQAWHWVRPDLRYVKAAEALTEGGTLALFWHRVQWHGEDLQVELEEVYCQIAPELHAQEPGFPGLAPPRGDDERVNETLRSGFFTDVAAWTHPWSATFTADTFVELLLTQSDHRLLEEHKRGELFEAIRQLLPRHGEQVVVPHGTFLVLARRL
jgi:SAM-dependent methyltransferase